MAEYDGADNEGPIDEAPMNETPMNETRTVLQRRRGPDPVALLVGLLSIAMAVAAFIGQLPDLSGLDPRWLLAAVAAAVGLALLAGSLRGRRGSG